MKPNNWRIALASRDGKVINEHFGRAAEFYIVDIQSDGTYKFIEKRSVKPLCSAGKHSGDALADHISALRDCVAVLVSQIGPSARRALEISGIKTFEHADYIDSALEKLARYFAKTNFTLPEE